MERTIGASGGCCCCACALAAANNAAQVTKNIATAQPQPDPRNSLITINNQDAESRAVQKLARDTRQIEEKQAIVKAGFSSESGEAPVIDSARGRSVQQFVTIISAARFVSGIADERLNFGCIETKRRSRSAHYVFLHHHRTEVVRPIF